MNQEKIEIIKTIVYNFSKVLNLNEEETNKFIFEVTNLKENDALDLLIVQIH